MNDCTAKPAMAVLRKSDRSQLVGVYDAANHIVGLIVSDTDFRRRRRVFVGHDKEGSARVTLMDRDRRIRMLLQVASTGTPSLSFLDENGKGLKELGAE
jgi:hypothetical protein